MIKKNKYVEDAYYGDIIIDKYDYKNPEEYRDGSKITFVAPDGYCLEGMSCRSIEPIGQEKVGTGIIVKYKDGSIEERILNSNNDVVSYVVHNPQDEKFVTKATYRETVYYTEPKKEKCVDGMVIESFGDGTIVSKNGRALSKHRVLTLTKENY